MGKSPFDCAVLGLLEPDEAPILERAWRLAHAVLVADAREHVRVDIAAALAPIAECAPKTIEELLRAAVANRIIAGRVVKRQRPAGQRRVALVRALPKEVIDDPNS